MPCLLKQFGAICAVAVLFSLNIFLAPSALADEKVLRVAQMAGDGWVVRQATGPVRRDGTDRAVAVGDKVATGERLITGPGGRAVLERRHDKITMSPNSDMKLGDSKGDSLFTSIVQSLGTLLFQVEKNPRQRFQVGTPFLAATVKGTTFTVSVRPEGAAVHVTDGAVQVAARGGQRAVIVLPGQTGAVSSKPGAEVEIRKREGKAKPPAAKKTESDTAQTAKTGKDGKAPGKGLARAVGTEPANFAKLTKGFAGNANGSGKSNAGRSNGKGKAGADTGFISPTSANVAGSGGKRNSFGRDNVSRPSVGVAVTARPGNSAVSNGRSGGNNANSGNSRNAGGNGNSGGSNSVATVSSGNAANAGASNGAGNAGGNSNAGGNGNGNVASNNGNGNGNAGGNSGNSSGNSNGKGKKK